jgi:hypothetical protein
MKNATQILFAALLAFSFSCTKEKNDSQEIPSESYRKSLLSQK